MLLEGLLVMLDLPSSANLLEILASNVSWQSVLIQDQFWEKMLITHFGGDLPPVEHFNDVTEQEVESDHEEEDEVQEEEDEVQEEEDDDDDEMDLLANIEADAMMEEDNSLLGDSEEAEADEDTNSDAGLASTLEAEISARQPSATTQMATTVVAETSQMATLKWVNGVPSPMVLDVACPKLTSFLRSAEQLIQFDTLVQILQGDIGKLETVGDQRVDGLAFPTASHLEDPHTGAASVIFRRAGQKLRDHVADLNIRLNVGDAIVTAGFDAGVDKLIHCVGPNGFQQYCMRDLQRTYRSVLRCIQQENLHCVAVVSISTGNMGLPVDRAAWVALCAIQRYIRSVPWTATIAIVCYDADAFAAYTKSKTEVLSQFNAEALRAFPTRN
ncbi:hypothetical protein CCR75_001710 [Bremia lactucae]|uniref:Macro domain-containing protein n=1 Tax=Bremia lactucae TaxID=4779 RepID=A0A976FGW8_BRELC|nr:hypothetical protein CCR75_001710 [Bremia lactucae]